MEGDTVFIDRAQLGQRHDLEPAGIGEDRAVPVHETVQAAEPGDTFRSGAQHEVVGVGQDDIGARIAHGFRRHGFDGRRRAYGHESGRADNTVRCAQFPGARRAVGMENAEICGHAPG